MRIDYWYSDRRDVAFATCVFYPNDCIYRGNIYDAYGNAIGDYSCRDSVEIEKHSPGIFGD